jgi:hypothetical protein
MTRISDLPEPFRRLAESIDALDGSADGRITKAELARAARAVRMQPDAFPGVDLGTLGRLEALLGAKRVQGARDVAGPAITRRCGPQGLYESTLFPAAGGLQREVISLDSPENPGGLNLRADQVIPLPHHLLHRALRAARVTAGKQLQNAPWVEVAGKAVPLKAGKDAVFGPITLRSGGPATVKTVELFFDAPPVTSAPGPDVSGDPARLTETQAAVLADVRAEAARRSAQAYPELLRRAQDLGYTVRDVDLALAHVRDHVPTAIHFNPDKRLLLETREERVMWWFMVPIPYSRPSDATVSVDREEGLLIDAFIVDGQYKNQFETGVTTGSNTAFEGGARDQWEWKIFDGGYHRGAFKPQERPKYGSFEVQAFARGSAERYGNCRMVLKPGVRERITITPTDSSACTSRDVGTPESSAHVLLKLPDFGFSRLMTVARGHGDTGPSPNFREEFYVESQIHGPVEFAKDVDHVVASASHSDTEVGDKLRAWAEQNGIPILWSLHTHLLPSRGEPGGGA